MFWICLPSRTDYSPKGTDGDPLRFDEQMLNDVGQLSCCIVYQVDELKFMPDRVHNGMFQH